MAKERIDKIFSGLGLLSRADCKKAVKQGRIWVNGFCCKSSDEKADPDVDRLFLDGQEVCSKTFVYYMFHKPAGCITAREDKHAKTVFDYVEDTRTDLNAVGRLDKDTTGILLLTNDGDLNHRLLSPRYHVPKVYDVLADGSLTEEDVALLERGLDIGDEKPTLPAKCEILSNESPARVLLTITEGRFHQVKRMFEAVGKPVLKLHRCQFGPLTLDEGLQEGQLRPLSEDELALLNQAAGRENL